MAYAILGPAGTFSEEAAHLYWSEQEDYVLARSIPEIFTLLITKQVEGALIPIENSLAGSINLCMEALESSNVYIMGEISIPVRQQLMAGKKLDLADIELLVSQPTALMQCQNFIKSYLPEIRQEITDSTTRAAKIVRSEERRAACIGNSLACSLYGLEVIQHNIQDGDNFTRFVHVQSGEAPGQEGEKSSIVFTLPDRPGALYHTLEIFARRNLNLIKIESRPGKLLKGSYSFYIEVENRSSKARIEELLKELHKQCTSVKYLGSYSSCRPEKTLQD
ncbi:MAG: prephenate dehydratase [Syntrophomonas sp.]|uniref:prephenate dehydratase n=1 Tax=Syntrophomonas sp. TaxID=2053627 RepID=UPI00262BC70F|nr:prephenate dehydratase [Syntrophomonas sp.]MDD2509633.1 prephenate dehydratase [Syntrophomonas sp.]MDD3878948.1 prephenate dehydratase [Syntrophomonas sp.]MDD4625705.1 prephenate dehydratase [Syntrophomonas sp.]